MLSVRDIAHRLKKIDLLAGFDEDSIAKLASRAHERHYIAGETIFLRGDKGDCFYVVVSGRVRIVLGVSDGREMTLRHQGPGTILGEIAMLDGRARSADAMALDPTSLVRISRTHFMEIMERQPKLAQALLGALCARLRVLTDQVEAIALFPLETRLARLFLQLIGASGESGPVARIPANVTQAELAALIVASRSKVNKTLSHWRDTGLLKVEPGHFVFDVDALKEISSLDATSASEWQEHTIT
ncbi:MAG: family transcriptional regulator, cyclic receptor protein [Methylobacteriaceae bacterium]|jgi:CRP-like cAMP-binding protein|nr:family transcriptional regulator, cyclic receptor protein [Methylobacteriaceae bacterium]